MSNEFNQIGANMGVNPLVMGVADAGLKTAGERMRAYIPGLSGAWHALRFVTAFKLLPVNTTCILSCSVLSRHGVAADLFLPVAERRLQISF